MLDLYLFYVNRPVIHTSADDNQVTHRQLPDDPPKVLCRLKRGTIDHGSGLRICNFEDDVPAVNRSRRGRDHTS